MNNEEVIRRLSIWGCDTNTAIRRVANDPDYYVELLFQYKDTMPFDELEKQIKKGDVEGAFGIAHKLKGMLGNLGLTPLYKTDYEMVEILRAGSLTGVAERMTHLSEKRREFENILKDDAGLSE